MLCVAQERNEGPRDHWLVQAGWRTSLPPSAACTDFGRAQGIRLKSCTFMRSSPFQLQETSWVLLICYYIGVLTLHRYVHRRYISSMMMGSVSFPCAVLEYFVSPTCSAVPVSCAVSTFAAFFVVCLSYVCLCCVVTCSIYIPGLPDSADKEAIRNLFAGLFEAQRCVRPSISLCMMPCCVLCVDY